MSSELELTRTPGDRRRYVLEGVGELRLEGWLSRAATAETGGRSWRFAQRGLLRTVLEATDAAGAPAGEFAGRRLHRGGVLRWQGRELALRPSSRWRERYAVVDGDRELAVVEGKGWGKRPVAVTVDDPAAIDDGLLLFAAFVVHRLAEDASSTAGATAGG